MYSLGLFLIGQKIPEIWGFVVSELVVGSVEQDRKKSGNKWSKHLDVLYLKRKLCAKAQWIILPHNLGTSLSSSKQTVGNFVTNIQYHEVQNCQNFKK